MTPGARVAAAIDCLDAILDGAPAEQVLTRWARGSRFAGSKDRAAVRDLVFDGLRRRDSLAAIGGQLSGRGIMIGAAVEAGQADALFSGEGYAAAPLTGDEGGGQPDAGAARDMPHWLWILLQGAHGNAAGEICAQLRTRAPVTLRVNRHRGTLKQAQTVLELDGIVTTPVADVPGALIVTENPRRIANSRAYKEGVVELQDASAQRFCDAIDVSDGQRVLDYCAGGGGKVLAVAARAKISAVAHDAYPARMTDIPARAARAGVEIEVTDVPTGLFDHVICDVPCSGSGTWRRDPQSKWTLTADRLMELSGVQREIITTAHRFVRPGGMLWYATCSVLQQENQDQVDWISDHLDSLKVLGCNHVVPTTFGDGFFWASFRKLD